MPESLTLSGWELALRVAVAAALGGLIGFERELGDQPAGFRTHILVSLGSALFTLVGAYGATPFLGGNDVVRLDPTRVAAQIVTGIGFLGAGAILRHGFTVRGLTTAAALWVTAAIGMAAGGCVNPDIDEFSTITVSVSMSFGLRIPIAPPSPVKRVFRTTSVKAFVFLLAPLSRMWPSRPPAGLLFDMTESDTVRL